MRKTYLLVTMAALALTSACSRGGTANNASANNSAAAANEAVAEDEGNAAEPAAANGATAGESGGAVDIAFLTGRWGVNGDCTMAMEFRADGTVTPPDGSTYTIEGSVVTVNSPGQPPDPKTVTRTGDDAMTVSGGGTSMNMTRCR